MKEKKNQKQLLLILLWVLLGCMFILILVNAFFIWQLYFVNPEAPSKEDLVGQTLTVVISQNGEDETPTPEQATETSQPTLTPELATPTASQESQADDSLYVVRQGETLQNIAEAFGVKIEDLRAKNQMLGDFLLAEQDLLIPQQDEIVERVLVFSSMTSDEDYLLMPQANGSEDTAIDIYMEENRFAFQASPQISQLVQEAFSFTANTLEGEVPERVTVFVGAGPFNPQTSIRSFYNTEMERLYLLHDGSGNFADLSFQAVYGMSMLWGEKVWGGSPDAVLREGMAYSMADTRSIGSGNLNLCDVAWTYQQMEKLPKLTSINNLDVEWTRNMVNLSTAGCYYAYLIENYDADVVQGLYQTGDYSSLESGSFSEEEALFENWLTNYVTSQSIDPEMFVEQMDRLLSMNKLFFADFERWDNSTDIYYALDQARLGLWRNDVRYAMVRMTTAGAMLGLTTNIPTVEPQETPLPDADPTSDAVDPTQDPFATRTPWPTWKPILTP